MADATRQFIDLASLGRYARWLLYGYMAVEVVSLISEYREYAFVAAIKAGTANMATLQEDAAAVDAVEQAVGVVELLALLVVGVTVLRWIYRANSNLHASGVPMEFTPGWAVGWYFVPVATLWKPFQAMREIWLKSIHGSADARVPPLLRWWWALWLIGNLAGTISFRLTVMAGSDIDTLLAATVGAMTSSLFDIPTAYLLSIIVTRVSDAQTHRLTVAEVF